MTQNWMMKTGLRWWNESSGSGVKVILGWTEECRGQKFVELFLLVIFFGAELVQSIVDMHSWGKNSFVIFQNVMDYVVVWPF